MEDEEIDMSSGAVNQIWEDTPLVRKINELVDAVNELQGHIKFLDERIKTKNFMVDIDKTNPVSEQIDPYAEQRKWVGKNCKFWDYDYDYEHDYFDTLKGITDDGLFIGHNGTWKHCEPVKPDNDIIYKGGKDE